MKVVFVADLTNQSASSLQRLWALKQFRVEVFTLNKDNYKYLFGNWAGYTAKTLKQPRLMYDCNQLEQELISLCERIRPEIVWLEWGREIQPNVLIKLKSMIPRPLLISFQDDNPWGERQEDKWMWKQYFKAVPEFDLHLVKRSSDIVNLKELGAKSCNFWNHGIYSPIFYPSLTPEKIQYPVSFVGTCIDKRENLIGHLLEKGIPIHIFGNLWKKRSDLPKRFPANFHNAVEGEAYANVIRQSQICLGLVSHSNQDEWTMRTYEVPGCAKLLLAERTPKHESLFIEGQEAEFFSTPDECISKLNNLLENPDICYSIGKAAYRKCIENNWTLKNRMGELLSSLKKL